MKVTILQDYLRCGGTESHSIFLTKMLNEHKIPTKLLTFRPGGALAYKMDPRYWYSLQNIDVKLDFYAPRLSSALSKQNPDCIICMGRVANLFGEYLKHRFKDKKIITTVRTGKKIPFFYKRSLIASDLILCNSNWAKEQLIQQAIPPDKIKVIYNPLLLNKINIPNYHLREYCYADKATVVFLCVQNFRKGKHHKRLIEYFSQLDLQLNWQLWLVGSGKEQKKCEYLVNKLKLKDRILFFGHQKDPRPFYEEADVAVSVSQEDSLPNFLLEAQQWGLPVVGMGTGGVKETFIPNETGFLISKDDSKDLLNRCNYFIHNPNEIKIFGEKAMELCANSFSPTTQSINLINLLTKLFLL